MDERKNHSTMTANTIASPAASRRSSRKGRMAFRSISAARPMRRSQVAGKHADIYALWGETHAQVAETIHRIRAAAAVMAVRRASACRCVRSWPTPRKQRGPRPTRILERAKALRAGGERTDHSVNANGGRSPAAERGSRAPAGCGGARRAASTSGCGPRSRP